MALSTLAFNQTPLDNNIFKLLKEIVLFLSTLKFNIILFTVVEVGEEASYISTNDPFAEDTDLSADTIIEVITNCLADKGTKKLNAVPVEVMFLE